MKYKAVIFDLDGTLLDTLRGITDAVNLTFEELGYPLRHDYVTARHFIGAGAMEFVRRASIGLNLNEKQAAEVGQTFLKNYLILQRETTAPFEGISDLLKDLKKAGYFVCLASNKPQHLLEDIIDKTFPDVKFDLRLGQRKGIPEKPNPHCIYEVMKEFNLSNKDCLYIGDSSYDYETAKNANIDCCIVKYGYGFYDQDFVKKSTFAVDSVSELRNLLLK